MKVILPNKQKTLPESKGSSLMKMLLTNRLTSNGRLSKDTESSSARSLPYSCFRKLTNAAEDEDFKMCEYINWISGLSRLQGDIVQQDHTYARSTRWQTENYLAKPCRYLYTGSIPKKSDKINNDVDINTVVQEEAVPLLPHPSVLSTPKSDSELGDDSSGDEAINWDDRISRVGWSAAQVRILPKIVRLIDDVQLPRLAFKGRPNEELQVDTALSALGSRLSSLFASVNWDKYITQWLHGLFMEKASTKQKRDYLELLMLVKKKCPVLVDRMIMPTHVGRSTLAKDVDHLSVGNFTKSNRVAESLAKEPLGKLPHGPVFLVVPPSIDSEKSERLSAFLTQVRQMAQVYVVNFKSAPTGTTINQCLDQMVTETRARLTEIRSDYSGRPIILVGWTLGSAIACLVAQLEPVHAVICLGFPMKTIDGNRGLPNDPILDMTCPVLFIIGAESNLVRQEELEEMRAQMKVATQLVMFGCCNDRLLMSRKQMMNLCATQTMVDRSIVLEIYNFVGELLTQPPMPPPRPVVHPIGNATDGKRTAAANKRKYVIAEVKDSPSVPPATKRPRTAAVKQSEKAITSSSKVTVVTPNSPPKRKPRMTPTQKLMLNSAKYAAELPPDYAAKLQQASVSAHSEPPVWSSQLKPPPPSNLCQQTKIGHLPRSAPEPVPTRRAMTTPTQVAEQGNQNSAQGPRAINTPGLISPKRVSDSSTKVVHISSKPRSLNLIQPGSTLLLTATTPKTAKASNTSGAGTTLIASHVKPLGNLKSIMSLPPRVSRYLPATSKPADGSKLTVIHTNMDFNWLTKTGDAAVKAANSSKIDKELSMSSGGEVLPIFPTVTPYSVKNTKECGNAVESSSVEPTDKPHVNLPMSLNDELLTPDAILQLPIIFAKDGENIFDLPVQKSFSQDGSFAIPLEVPCDVSSTTSHFGANTESTSATNVIVISSDRSSNLVEPGINAPKKYTRRSNSTFPAKYTKVILTNSLKNPQSNTETQSSVRVAEINLPLSNDTANQVFQCESKTLHDLKE